MDAPTPPSLSAKFPDSFAFKTIKDRLPVILTKTTDIIHRQHTAIMSKYGEKGDSELKKIIGTISKLRYEVMTDKPVSPLTDQGSDTAKWNGSIEAVTAENGGEPVSWFTGAWLYVECYMYRRLQEGVRLCSVLNFLDVFGEQKREAYLSSNLAITALMTYLMHVTKEENMDSSEVLYKLFKEFVQVALWGNKCDLSISAGHENSQKDDPLEQLNFLSPYILVDNVEALFSCITNIKAQRGSPGRVDIVLDNAGFELVTDLCLAEFLLSSGLASSVHFHGKAMPWFVSDVTQEDFDWTLQQMRATNNLAISHFGSKWKDHLKNGSWVFHAEDFWTLPYDYSRMKDVAPELYQDLGKADLVLFKGDLNYRKLVGDLNWNPTTPFVTSLRGFHPAPLCALRALKADVVTGLQQGQAEEVAAKDGDWMINGNWAVIQFCERRER